MFNLQISQLLLNNKKSAGIAPCRRYAYTVYIICSLLSFCYQIGNLRAENPVFKPLSRFLLITPTRSIQLFTKHFCLVNILLLYRYSNCFLLSFCNSKFTVSKQYHHLLYRLYCIIGAYQSQHFKVIKLSFISV